MDKRALLISIRPRFAEMIFKGLKTVELRRVCPKVRSGDLALIYVSSPVKEVQGAFEVGNVVSLSPKALWKRLGSRTGIVKREFLAYFAGKRLAHAMIIRRAWKLQTPIRLTHIR